MKALYYQPSCGIAGDMHLAALVSLGMPEAHLADILSKLPLQDEFTMEFSHASKMGITGLQTQLAIQDQSDHRHHSTIVRMIEEANLPAGITQRALEMFDRIAQAEGKIHNVPPSKVHFHEVGAMDSIIDIVGAAAAIEYFQPDIVLCDVVELGSGFVNCAHGRLPVPAPATQEILSGMPCRYGTVDGEATTPTGAAILSQAVNVFLPKGAFTPSAIGYGVGRKDFGIPNVLRVALGSYEPVDQEHSTAAPLKKRFPDVQTGHYKIETNIDDMSPEAFAPLMDALFNAGAIDVYTQPIMMKKQRPAQCVTALCQDSDLEAVTDTLLNSSTSIGLRIVPFAKRVLQREQHSVTTSLGDVSVKVISRPDGHETFKVEHADILQAALDHQLDYLSAERKIIDEVRRFLGNST
jgi:uncharacterized protein (TIGR00299 family) protein